ncbi:MAG: diguanylate cyclase domain-containing protein [Actinomycetota bacterium]
MEKIKKFKILALGIAACAVYWILESAIDFYIFKREEWINSLLPGEGHEIWIRVVVIALILAISLYLQVVFIRIGNLNARLEHIKQVFASVQDVNQIIAREHHKDTLLEKTCATLVKDKGFFNCWIALKGRGGNIERVYSEGLGKEFGEIKKRLHEGKMPYCIRKASKAEGALFISTPDKTCQGCGMSKNYTGRGSMCTKLERRGKIYGYLVVSSPKEYIEDPEEKSLFEEVAGDIEYALENIELENIRKENEERIVNSARKFKTLFNNINDAVFIHDLEGNFLEVNEVACSRLGYSRDEFFEMSPREIDSPEYSTLVEERIKELKEKGAVFFETEHVTKSGKKIPVELNSKVIDYEGQKAILSVARDITERKQAEKKIEELVYYDPLTGLPNRRLLDDRFKMALASAERNSNIIAVTMMDLDDFKDVNDSLGHNVGDKLLKEAANRLEKILRKTDTVARLGGDEFILLIPSVKNRKAVEAVAKKILSSFRKPFKLNGQHINSTISIGIAVYPNDGKTKEELTKKADAAMYRIKGKGKNSYYFYSS